VPSAFEYTKTNETFIQNIISDESFYTEDDLKVTIKVLSSLHKMLSLISGVEAGNFIV
jgi:hypothetical protein